MDSLKKKIYITIPIVWSVICFSFFVYYFVKKRNEVLFLPLVSFLASILFIYDIWYYYLPSLNGYSRIKAPNSIINFKLTVCGILFSLSCISIILSFNLTFDDNTAWSFLNIVFGIVWAIITIKYQKYNESNTNDRNIKELNQLTDDREIIENDF